MPNGNRASRQNYVLLRYKYEIHIMVLERSVKSGSNNHTAIQTADVHKRVHWICIIMCAMILLPGANVCANYSFVFGCRPGFVFLIRGQTIKTGTTHTLDNKPHASERDGRQRERYRERTTKCYTNTRHASHLYGALRLFVCSFDCLANACVVQKSGRRTLA